MRRETSLNSRREAEKKKIEEKEKGFNVHINGANEERIKEQRRQELLRGASQGDSHSQQRVRRMWKNPNGSQERQQEVKPNVPLPTHGHHPKYHNPFDIRVQKQNESKDSSNRTPVSGGAARKRWGEPANSGSQTRAPAVIQSGPTKASHDLHRKSAHEEESYSDSFEEIQQEIEAEQQDDNKNRSVGEDDDQLEQFLRTATHQDIENLKNSLSTFGFVANKPSHNQSKNRDIKVDDEDYIEEEFENEHIESDNDSSDESEKERLAALEQQKKLASQAHVLVSKNVQTARNAKNRPISATFNLEATKVSKQQTIKTGQNPFDASGYQQTTSFAVSQLSSNLQPSQSVLSLAPKEKPSLGAYKAPVSVSVLPVADTPKQPNDFMKKPINTNPFKRPFSQAVPQRPQKQAKGGIAQRDDEFAREEIVFEDQYEEEEKITKAKNSAAKEQPLLIEQSIAKSSQSQKVPIGAILQKIEQLDDWQKEKLMELLDNFDANLISIPQSTKKESEKHFDLKFLSPAASQNPPQGYQRPVGSIRNIGFGIPKGKQEIIVRVLGTYGNPHICGLTEIELFDHQGMKIQIVPAIINVRNLGQGPKNSLTKLIDGHKLTNEERHMWIGYRPPPPKTLEIVILLPIETKLGGLKIWNYNKSAIDCTKGVKEVQIVSAITNEASSKDEHSILWTGNLERGRGQVNVEFATFIRLNPQIELPREIKAQPDKKAEIESISRQDDKTEELKKHRSEAFIPVIPNKQADNTPIWLGTDRRQSNIASTSSLKKEVELNSKPFITRRNNPSEENKGIQSTIDLLNRPLAQKDLMETEIPINTRQEPTQKSGSSTQGTSVKSEQQSQNSSQQAIISNKIAGEDSNSRKSSESVQNTSSQLRSYSSKQQLQETSDAIKQAVSKVNMLTNPPAPIAPRGIPSGKPVIVSHPEETKKTVPVQMEPIQEVMNIDESLENLELFQATNLGRLLQNQNPIKDENDKGSETIKSQGSKKSLQQRWQASPGSSHKHRGAPMLVKNPFPDKIPVGQQKNSIASGQLPQKKAINFDETDDILDQFLSHNVASLKVQEKIQVKQETFEYIQKSEKDAIILAQPNLENPSSYEEKLRLFSEDFVIPQTPQGKTLHFNILSTWGDVNYVGLTGIEIFGTDGKQVKILGSQITACPPDINILPGYGGDPRTVDKLVDGNYYTNDDLHVWLTPFTAGEDHTITIELPQRIQIAMIRIWNYNKSRIHSYRGARLMTCELDSKLIFRGEVQKAPGNLNDPEACCEIILFTDKDGILDLIDKNDWINQKIIQNNFESTQKLPNDMVPSFIEERPMTATKKFGTSEIEEIQRQLKQQKPTSLFDERPQTSAIIGLNDEENQSSKGSNVPQPMSQIRQAELSGMVKNLTSFAGGLSGKVIEINITETWGDLFYVGLTGIEIIDSSGKIIPINIQNVNAKPRDMNSIAGHGQDYRTLDKLFDGVNNTTDDHKMWLIPFNQGEKHTITIDLGKNLSIGAIRFYNYNKSEEDTLRGAKQVVIWLDKKYITPKKGITLRKAPGCIHPMFNMAQEIKVPIKFGWTTEQIMSIQKPLGQLGLFQEYELNPLPIGFMFRFNLYSTHGDFFYIGLNGIELFDQNGYLIKLTNVCAQPQGVHILQEMKNDIRVVSNIINGKNQTFDENNMWLAPFKNTRSYSAVTSAAAQQKSQQQVDSADYRIPNYVCIWFDEPKAISAIRLWNYSKTPSRGVNEFELVVDDKQIFRGFARQAPSKEEYERAPQNEKDFSSVVLFTTEEKIVDKLSKCVTYDPSKQQSVTLVNEKKIMNMNAMKQRRPNEEFSGVYNEMERPTTMAHKKLH